VQPLPASVRSWLADAQAGEHPDVAGLPLPRVTPMAADFRRSVATLEAQLQPADYDHVVFCVAKLISGFNERLTKEEAKARARLWQEIISDVPKDLWSAGTIELLRSWRRDDHYGRSPDASDLRACIEAKLSQRMDDLKRCRAGLAQANAPEQAIDVPIREKPAARLKRIMGEQRVKAYADETHRYHDMANTERALAFEEKRPMADWAWQFFDDRVDPASRSVGAHAKRVVSGTEMRMAELAAARREGVVPPPRDIPEAAHGP
jgi:hypothetical protein